MSRVERHYPQCVVTAGSSTISEDQKLRPPQLINFTSPYLNHQRCKWHDLDTVLIASMSRVEGCHPRCAVTAGWSTISEDRKLWPPGPKNFLVVEFGGIFWQPREFSDQKKAIFFALHFFSGVARNRNPSFHSISLRANSGHLSWPTSYH